jgi:uncharacterized protein YjbJ (UPF0337 family)
MKDKVQGAKDEIEGKGKEVIGKLGGDRGLEAEGKLQQIKGGVEKKIGDIKEP